MNLYTFAVVYNLWNNFDVLVIVFSCLHLVVPVYTIALSFYQVPLAQTIIYYLSSGVVAYATVMLFFDGALSVLGLFIQALTEVPTMQITSSNLVTSMYTVFFPFAAMSAFLYYEIYRFQQDYIP